MRIKSYENKEEDVGCIGCALQKGLIKTSSGLIYKGKYFEVRQDYELPVKGFFIISSKRHIVGIADFTKKEQEEFMKIIYNLRKIMRDNLRIGYVDLFMREETIESKRAPSHFHLGLLPKYDWMKKFDSTIKIFEYARKKLKTKENLNEINKTAEEVRKLMAKEMEK